MYVFLRLITPLSLDTPPVLFLTLCQYCFQTFPPLLVNFTSSYRLFPSTPCLPGSPTSVFFGLSSSFFSLSFPFFINLVHFTWILSPLENISIIFSSSSHSWVALGFTSLYVLLLFIFTFAALSLTLPWPVSPSSATSLCQLLFVRAPSSTSLNLSSPGHSSVKLPFCVFLKQKNKMYRWIGFDIQPTHRILSY